MTTVYCPVGHIELAREAYTHGHVPGHQYHDVEVLISRRGVRYRCHVVETWGSDQGYLQERGRLSVVGRGGSLREATSEASSAARQAGIKQEYLAAALSVAADAAEEADDPVVR